MFYIPSGMIHAVGKGLVIAEIQQSANTTYRVYDYNRRDANRKLRGLHIEKAIEVAQLNLILGKEKRTTKVVKVDTCIVKKYIESNFFPFEQANVSDEYVFDTDNKLQLIFIEEGSILVDGVGFNKGESGIVPACNKACAISGKASVLRFWK